MSTAELHLLRPTWLLALVALLPMAWVWLRRRRAAGPWERLCDAHLLRHLIEPGSARASRSALALLALGWAAACLALAGPTWERLPEVAFREPSRTVFVLALTPSMTQSDVRPSRIARARFELMDALDRVAGGSTALVVYREEAFAVTPLTDDANVLREQVPLLRTALMPGRRALPARGIEEAQRLLERVGAAGSRIVLLSDGEDDDPGATRTAARAAAAAGARVSVLSLTGDSAGLEALASEGGGAFAALAADDSDLDRVLAEPDPLHAPALVRSDVQADHWRDAGAWLVWVPLLLAPAAFRRGWAGAALVVLAVGIAPPPASADLLDWFRRPDQRAARAFDAGRYAEAGQEFRDPAWQAAARYRAGDFAGAAAALEGRPDPVSQYNLGNALARAGQLEPALEAYEQSLAANPRDADAKWNRDLVKRLLDEQQQEQQQDPEQQQQQQSQSSPDGGKGESGQEPPPHSDPDSASQGEEGAQGDPQANAGDDAREGGEPGEPAPQDAPPEAGPDAQAGKDAGSPEPPGSDAAQADPRVGNADGAPLPGSGEPRAPSAKETEAAQWMARLPDDPGGLLRERIRRDYVRKQRARAQGEQP